MKADNKLRTTVLFDLDGTLLPMDNSVFEKAYFKGLCKTIPDFPPEQLISVIWAGTKAMVLNDGSKTNREAFAEVFTAKSGIDYYSNEERFLRFYRTDFQKCAEVCQLSDISKKAVDTLGAKGYRTAVATNPVFPGIATDSRLRWLGIDPSSFLLVTNFENSRYAKPNPKFYEEVCSKLNVSPQDCVMIGNDVEEDGCAAALGMKVILITDCLINRKNLPLDKFEQTSLAGMLEWAENLPDIT